MSRAGACCARAVPSAGSSPRRSGASAVTTAVARGLSPIRTVLDSGAVVIVQETPMTPAVTINATVRAGGVHEPPVGSASRFWSGASSIAERCVGPPKYSPEELDDRGVSLRVASSATRRSSAARACRRISSTCSRSSSTSCGIRCFPSRRSSKRQAELHLGDPPGRGQPIGARGRDAVRDALRRVASVRPPGQGNGRERRAHHARRSRGVPRRAVQARRPVAGDCRSRGRANTR